MPEAAFDVAAVGLLEDFIAWDGQEVFYVVEMRVQGDEATRRALALVQLIRDDLAPPTREYGPIARHELN